MNMSARERAYRKLDELSIRYEVVHHPAVFTIEEMDNLGIEWNGDICKNLFLRDEKGKRHILVVLRKDKKADLKSLQSQLETSRLSFASEDRLNRYLHLSKGEVTPLGILNDVEAKVEVAFDRDLTDKERLGVHPNDNTATVWISFASLKKVIEDNGNVIRYVDI